MTGNVVVQVLKRGPGEVGLALTLPDELVDYIAAGGDMKGKRALMQMDREGALVLAEELRRAAVAT